MNIRVNFGGNTGSGINVVSPFTIPVGDNLVDAVKPNVIGEYEKVKSKTVKFSIIIPISFVVFIVSMIMMFTTGKVRQGWEHFHETFGDAPKEPNLAWLPVALIAFAAVIIFAITTAMSASKQSKLRKLRTAILEIKGRDRVSLDSLSINRMGFFHVNKSTVIMVLKRLIDTGNLEEYEIIGDIGIAKTSVRARPSDFAPGKYVEPAKEENQIKQRRSTCPGCGAGIGRSKGRVCDFCGSLLD